METSLAFPKVSALCWTGQITYDWHLRQFNSWLNGRNLTLEEIARYLEAAKSRYRAATVRNKKAALKKGVLLTFPDATNDGRFVAAVDAAFRRMKVPEPTSRAVVNQILEKQDIRRLKSKIKNPRVSLFIRFLFASGLRVSEMLSIRSRSCARMRDRVMITVVGKGSAERKVDISRRLYEEVRATFESPRDGYLFHCERSKTGRYSRQYVWREIHASGIEYLGQSIGAHTLRHSHATALIARGAPVDAISDRLGHRDRATTARFYLHSRLTPSHLRAAEV